MALPLTPAALPPTAPPANAQTLILFGATARGAHDDTSFRQHARKALEEHTPASFDAALADRFPA